MSVGSKDLPSSGQRTVKSPERWAFGGTVAVGATVGWGVDFRILGPLEVAQDILSDPNLQAMIERAEAERRTGCTHSHGEVLEWERSQRD